MNNDRIKTKNEIWIAGGKLENNGQLKHEILLIYSENVYT